MIITTSVKIVEISEIRGFKGYWSVWTLSCLFLLYHFYSLLLAAIHQLPHHQISCNISCMFSLYYLSAVCMQLAGVILYTVVQYICTVCFCTTQKLKDNSKLKTVAFYFICS